MELISLVYFQLFYVFSKPEDGIEYLIDNELLDNQPKSIAEFLRKETSISKLKISEYFGKLRKETNRLVLQ